MHLLVGTLISFLLLVGSAEAQCFGKPGFCTGANSGPPPSYTGPGDLVASATVWVGLRAYNAAYATATGNIGIFRRSSDNATCTGISNTAGALDLTTTYCSGTTNLPTFCGNAAGSCFATTLYDQSGALSCGGARCDVVQATAGLQPPLVFSCIGSLPCLQATGSYIMQIASANLTVSVPFSISSAGLLSPGAASFNTLVGNPSGDILYFTSTPTIVFNVGGGPSIAIVVSTWYAAALTAATNSTILYANSLTPASTGTTAVGTGSWQFSIMSRGDCCGLDGNWVEGGMWAAAFTGPQTTSMIANQRTYWGF